MFVTLSACGILDEQDFSTRFTGSLTEREAATNHNQKSTLTVVATVCAHDQCGDANAQGEIYFKTYDTIDGGTVHIRIDMRNTNLARITQTELV